MRTACLLLQLAATARQRWPVPGGRHTLRLRSRFAVCVLSSDGAADLAVECVDCVAASLTPDLSFRDLGLVQAPHGPMVEENLRRMGIETPNRVQATSAPHLLHGRNVVLHASTGSGKTLAFLLPLLAAKLEPQGGLQCIILCPSKELAMQTQRFCSSLVEGTPFTSLPLVGGVNIRRQEERLRRERPQVVIATPRRLAELCLGKSRKLKMGGVRTIVVDEADEVLRAPHKADLVRLLRHAGSAVRDAHSGGRQLQLIFASATGDSAPVRESAREMMRSPLLISVHRSLDARGLPPTIAHGAIRALPHKRIETLKRVISMEPRPQVLAFVNSATESDYVAVKLNELGVRDVIAMHSSQERSERVAAIQRLLSGKLRAVVCTDIAARGLDVPTVTHVVNVELPEDGRRYVHRAGRCGRAGRTGTVVSIVTSDMQFQKLQSMAARLNADLRQMRVRSGQLSEVEPLDEN